MLDAEVGSSEEDELGDGYFRELLAQAGYTRW